MTERLILSSRLTILKTKLNRHFFPCRIEIFELIYPHNPIEFVRMVLKKEITDQIKDLLQKNPQGLRIKEIVESVKINRNTAGRYLENLLISGQVELRRFGMAKIYRISQRVPLSAILSISSESVIQLDSFLRIIFVNESFCTLVGTDSKNLVGKNIEYSPVALVFDELFIEFLEKIGRELLVLNGPGRLHSVQKILSSFAGSHRRFLMMDAREYPSFLKMLPNENKGRGRYWKVRRSSLNHEIPRI